jgi:hypothetical protein
MLGMKMLEMKYFVLKPKGNDVFAEASRAAMRRYAEIIKSVEPGMADELMEWVAAEDETKEEDDEEERDDLWQRTFDRDRGDSGW